MARHFSARTAWDTGESALAKLTRELKDRGEPALDLTLSNPTRCGFNYDSATILGALGDPASMIYDPDPRGLHSARDAVSAYYSGCFADVSAGQIILTTSTSEAYSFLFRLLCDPSDHVLVAQPSYPLFDFLSELDDVVLDSYPLFYDFGWWIDFSELERRIGPKTRAILLVHPNNPTGHATSREERVRLEELCVRHHLALIVDEVFLDYGLQDSIQSFAVGPHPCPTYVVSGISKILALPQMKLGWVAAFGPMPERAEALERLEIIADTFLSMNTPVQHALPHWLAGRTAIQQEIMDRVRRNLNVLEESGLSHLPVEAGWSVIAFVPQRSARNAQVDGVALTLLREAGVIVHPAAFYGFNRPEGLVLSLLGQPEVFALGLKKLIRWGESN